MRLDAEKLGPQLSAQQGQGDSRLTKVGRFLRAHHLDELPQLWNVFCGDMSFIGPRPKVGQIDYNNLTEDKRKSYSVKPGVTGYSQAYFRNSITNEEKYHYDAYYADHITFMMDVKIIFKTIKSVLFRENINTEQSYKK